MADLDAPEDEQDEAGVPLQSLPGRFTYLYDFGDGWEHDVESLGQGGDRPGCVAGESPCPPEDCGGARGYAALRAILANPGHPEHESRRAWAGEWSPRFDLARSDLYVRQMAGAVPEPVRMLLDLTAGGVKLTPGGRFPRAFVREIQERCPQWASEDKPAQLEEDLQPLSRLHDLLRGVRLLRMRGGVVAPARAAADEVQVVRRLRARFGAGHEFTAVLVAEAVALLERFGPSHPYGLAGRLLPLLGNHWVHGLGEPLTEEDLRAALYRAGALLAGLDLIHTDLRAYGSRVPWHPGPSARWLLPSATFLCGPP